MTFTKTIELPVSPDDAFALITEPERLRRWKTVSAYVDLRAGGAYRFTIVPGQTAAGTYREIEPGRRIVFGWGWEGSEDLPPDVSTVTVTIEETERGSRVTLVHEGLNAGQAASHAMGWNHYFDRLLALTVEGDAGQDEWHWVPDPMTPSTAADAVLSAIQPVLRGLADDYEERPTPCEGLSAGEVVEHLVGGLTSLAERGGATVVVPDASTVEERVSSVAAQAIDAWRTDGESAISRLLPLELLLHGWDLAQATGQGVRVSDELVAYLRGLAEGIVPGGRERGAFGKAVVPPADASPLDELAAYAGRSWPAR